MRARFSCSARVLAGVRVLIAGVAILGCDGSTNRPPNLVLVVIDTARADHFGSYGYRRDTTSNFDRFAENATRFENAYSTSCWTVPSHASLFTGLLPATHGANQVTQKLSGKFETLAERLTTHGYRTAAFSNNPWVSTRTNLVQGFETVYDMWRGKSEASATHPTNQAIAKWLSLLDPEQPFFLFVNLIEPHWPYQAPEPIQARFLPSDTPAEDRRRANFKVVDWYLDPKSFPDSLLTIRESLYDSDLFAADLALGGLLATLEEHEAWDDSLVVVTSDHGESLGEKGHQGHSFALYESAIRVPLAIKPPGQARDEPGVVRSEPVQLTDVFTTLMVASGLTTNSSATGVHDPSLDRVVGQDLLSAELPRDRAIISQYAYPEQFLQYFPQESLRTNSRLASYKREIRSLSIGSDKLIWGSDGRHELYDLASPEGESHDRSHEDPERVIEMSALLDLEISHLSLDEPDSPASVPPPDKVTEERLRELGYIR